MQQTGDDRYHAWNPGVQSRIPQAFLHLASIYRPENCAVPFKEIEERAAFTGLPPEELVVFRPQRLALHSLLIRITANLSVSDGDQYADLGINFRRMARKLELCHLQPMLDEIGGLYSHREAIVREHIAKRLQAVLVPSAPKPAQAARKSWWPWGKPVAPVPFDRSEHERQALASLAFDAEQAADDIERFCARALDRLLQAIATKHGRIVGDRDWLCQIASGMAMNVLASDLIGERVEDGFLRAAEAQGFRILPSQAHTVVLNTKGASASGKSTLRPRQRKLVDRLGYRWQDFALISPDIWRKYLLDYDSLGEAWRYAGSLSGHELKEVDKKLDLYMATRQAKRRSPHLLIDRFRFDSFQLSAARRGEERLLTRFGDEVHMIFMVTPPEALVARAFKRGLEVGRFKPLEDLLDHCVEAHRGMPPLFFRWALHDGKDVSYEILDNSVAKGEPPNTIAYGRYGELTIVSIEGMANVSRFERINIRATKEDELWPEGPDVLDSDYAFLRQCAERLRGIDIANPGSTGLVARLQNQAWTVFDHAQWQALLGKPTSHRALAALGSVDPQDVRTGEPQSRASTRQTIGYN